MMLGPYESRVIVAESAASEGDRTCSRQDRQDRRRLVLESYEGARTKRPELVAAGSAMRTMGEASTGAVHNTRAPRPRVRRGFPLTPSRIVPTPRWQNPVTSWLIAEYGRRRAAAKGSTSEHTERAWDGPEAVAARLLVLHLCWSLQYPKAVGSDAALLTFDPPRELGAVLGR